MNDYCVSMVLKREYQQGALKDLASRYLLHKDASFQKKKKETRQKKSSFTA